MSVSIIKKTTIFLLGALITTGAFAGKKPSPETAQGATTIDAAQAKELWLKGALFIDTRKGADWDAGRVPGALHLNIKKKTEFNKENVLKHISLNDPVVSYCNAEKCHRAYKGAKKLVDYGFTKVYYFRSGFPSWKNANYPYE